MVYKFESVAEFARHLDTAQTSRLFSGATCSALEESDHRTSFTSTRSFSEAVGLIRYGDAENFKKISSYRAAVRGGAEEVRRVNRLSVVGGSPCVPAYLRGVPASMIDKKRVRFNNGKVVNIVVDCTFPWSISAEDIARAGAVALSVVLGIEKKGYQVNLYACCGAYSGTEEVVSLVRVKSAGVHVDGVKLAYFLVNPSFLRRSWFRLVETTKGLRRSSWTRSYGTCMDEKQLKKFIPEGYKFVQVWKHLKDDPAALEAALLS